MTRTPKARITVDDIVDECKVFYMAGHETTSGVFGVDRGSLSVYTEWQEKAREELTMVINEALRLYDAVVSFPRRVDRKTKLGKYEIPKNVELNIPPLALHRNPEIWGQDAQIFNPQRFADGMAKATNGNSIGFLAFGAGPRVCVGLNFAAYEVKLTLSMILQRYKLTPSPNYKHAPFEFLTLRPQHGIQSVPTQSSSAYRTPFYMSPPEYWSAMANQFGMMPHPSAFSPQPPLILPSKETKMTSFSAFDTEKEPSKPSSIQESQFPLHSTQDVLENIALDTDNKHCKHGEGSTKRAVNRTYWSVDKEELLTKAWVTISCDSIVGNDQACKDFWIRIEKYFNEFQKKGTMSRLSGPLKNHWFLMQRDVNKYVELHNKEQSQRGSGWSGKE
ncbi:hypothetical protein DH2020_032285 [Rehmannia glutinosa]|uniref:Uncharacterized protein n=1 Tax=Rehmannia glutinosa TaxID=99300 RepID=A0ABR0VIN7_REHGL